MNVLAIETSCDETSVAIIRGSLRPSSKTGLFSIQLLANVVSSQVKIHAKWGGVVPNLAAREHIKNITPVLRQALQQANLPLTDIDLFATTQGPGLIPALLIGTNVAKTLSYFYQKPLIGIHHVEGHIYANFIREFSIFNPPAGRAGFQFSNKKNLPPTSYQRPATSDFPILALVVSGGHTQLIQMKDHLQYEIVGQTLDDAAGEAFDKIAKILDLGYPGGPIVSQRASAIRKMIHPEREWDGMPNEVKTIIFPRPLLGKPNLDFSFSGLKTAVLYFYQSLLKRHPCLNEKKYRPTLNRCKSYIAKAAEDAIVEVLVKKTVRGAKTYAPNTILLAGGVAANRQLQHVLGQTIQEELPEVRYVQPPVEFCGDNAAMIGVAALYRYHTLSLQNELPSLGTNWRTLEADANLKLS